MPRKLRALKTDLRRAGFTSDTKRGKGSHSAWQHPLVPQNEVTLAGHDGDDAQSYQERDVRRALDALKEALRSL